MADAGLLSDEDVGLAPASSAAPAAPAASNNDVTIHPASPAEIAAAQGTPQPMAPAAAPSVSTPSQAPSAAPTAAPFASLATAPASAPALLSDADVGLNNVPPPSAAGPLSNSDQDNWFTSAAKNVGTGIIKGLSNSFGTVGNLSNFADYLVARGESAVTGRPVNEIFADIQKQRAQEEASSPILSHFADPRQVMPSGPQVAAPILAQTGEYQPESEWGKAAQAGVEAAAGVVGPGGGAKTPGSSLLQAAVKAPLAAAPTNLVAGGVGQAVTDATGDPLIGMGAGNTVAGVGSIGANAVNRFTRPIAANGSPTALNQMVGEQLRARATNPAAVEQAINQPTYQLVPGSQPTTGQLTNDMGLLQAERQAQTADNSEFNLRQGQQNTAQLNALRGAKPANADAMTAPQAFQSQLDGINQAEDAAVGLMTSRAQDAASGLGPEMTPEDRGQAIRNGIQTVKNETAAARSALYRAVDPDGDLNTVATPIRESANDISSGVGQYAAQPEGEEASILSTGKSLPDVMSFRDLMDYDQRVTAAMKEERRAAGESPVWSRLSRLKGAVQGAINDSVANRAAYEQKQGATAAGEASDTVEQRLSDSLEALTARQKAIWGLDARGLAADTSGRIAGTGTDAGGFSSVGTSGRASSAGTAGESSGRVAQAQGDQGISPPPLRPSIDEAAAARLAAAKSAHQAYARTFKEGPVAPILKTQGFADNYTVPNSVVPSRVIVPGDRGYQNLQSFIGASKNDPAVIHAAKDQLVSHLAKTQNADGTVNPQGFAKWKQQYAGAIRAMDEASPGFSSRYKTAARATEDMIAAGVAKKQAIDSFNKSQAATFIGKTNPVEVENQLGSVLGSEQNGPTQMRALVAQAKRSPAALEGLRSAGIDWMMRQFSNAAEAPGTSENLLSAAKFTKFVRDNQATLSELYSPEQMSTFNAVAADLDRANRSVTATRIKGSPGTAKDIIPFKSKSESHAGEVLGPLAAIEGAKEFLHHAGSAETMAASAGIFGGIKAIKAIKNLRQAGIDKVQDAVKDALLNPDRARYYLGKSSPKEAETKWNGLSRSIRRSLIMQPALLQTQ